MLSGDFPKAEYSLYAPLLNSEVDGRLRKAVVLHCVKQSIPACAPGVVREVPGLCFLSAFGLAGSAQAVRFPLVSKQPACLLFCTVWIRSFLHVTGCETGMLWPKVFVTTSLLPSLTQTSDLSLSIQARRNTLQHSLMVLNPGSLCLLNSFFGFPVPVA